MVSSATAESRPAFPATLSDVIAGLRAHAGRVALIVVHDGKPSELSYGELAERILDTARQIDRRGSSSRRLHRALGAQ